MISGVLVVTTVCYYQCTRAAVAPGTRLSLLPPFFEGQRLHTSGASRRENANSYPISSLKIEFGNLRRPCARAYASISSGAVVLKWSIMTFAIAIRGSASASPQMPNTTPSRIWNANSVAGGMSSACRWMIGVST